MIHLTSHSLPIQFGISALFIILGFVIFYGKGDFLISGYNTASAEKKARVIIERLRLLVAIVLWSMSLLIALMPIYEGNESAEYIAIGCFCVIMVVYVILARTWAMRK